MIRNQIPGFSSGGNGDGRFGDAQIITNDSNSFALVIDGYCGSAADMLIGILKDRGLKNVYLYCSHPHYDHLDGLRRIMDDSYFTVISFNCYEPSSLNGGRGNSEIQDDIDYLNDSIKLAKNKGIPVNYLHHGDEVVIEDIKFNVYRKQEEYQGYSKDPHGWSFLNDGSLCFFFHELGYWTSGDGPMEIYTMCKSVGAKPVIFKIPHHGNNCPESQANGMYSLGARLCWDNSYSTNAADDFLKYGRRRCIEAGIKYVGIHGDINMIACNGQIHVYKDWTVYSYPCSYMGKNTLKGADSAIVADVINNKAGNGNARISYLLNRGYNPFSVQNAVNKELEKPKEGWVHNKIGWWYRYEDGTWPVSCWADLPCTGGTFRFLFDKNGYMLTGWQKAKLDGGYYWFYLDPVNGSMQKGWKKINGYWYYMNPKNGVMYTGWLDYKNKKCYLDASGKALCNCVKTIDGKTYSFDADCYATEYNGTINSVTGKINNLSETRKQFVLSVAEYVRKYAPQYGIKVYSPIIAQAIHESGWGESSLAARYHNYFGLKCGTKWNGKSVNLSTQEEYSAGTLTTITAFFRVYDSLEDGIKGYFDFIQLPRYSNLKGVTSPRQYLENIKNDGYATGSQYVAHNMTLIETYSLTQFDGDNVVIETPEEKTTSDANPIEVMLQIASAEVGYHEGANNKTKYGDEMHSIQPRNMDKNAAWCDAFVDWCVLQTCKAFGYGADMAREVLCGDFDDYTYSSIALYKKEGRWTDKPQRGNQIFFGGSGHTGVVESVDSKVHTIEGNKSDQVMRCSYDPNDSRIIGYGIPKWELLSTNISVKNYPLVKAGDKGYFVYKLQELLNSKTYAGKEILDVDGDFGPLTEAQVLAHQKSNGLYADGEVGPKTWGKLAE